MPTIFFDFDSTVCTQESLDEVIAYALKNHPQKQALVAQVEAITNQGMNGEIDFKQSLQARIDACPLNRWHFEAVGEVLKDKLTPGMPELFTWLKQTGWEVYIVSGGFLPSVLPAAESLGLKKSHVFTSGLRTGANGAIEGIDTSSLLWTNNGKAPVIEYLADTKNLSQPLVLVGDGSNDLAAFTAGAVDYFVGFGANVVREKVKAEASHFVSSVSELKKCLNDICRQSGKGRMEV